MRNSSPAATQIIPLEEASRTSGQPKAPPNKAGSVLAMTCPSTALTQATTNASSTTVRSRHDNCNAVTAGTTKRAITRILPTL